MIRAAVAAVRGGRRSSRTAIASAGRDEQRGGDDPAGRQGVAIRWPGNGDWAGLVTRPWPSGKRSTFSTSASAVDQQGGQQGEDRQAERAGGDPRAPARRVAPASTIRTSATGQAKSFNAPASADRDPGRGPAGRAAARANASRQSASTGRSSPPVARVSAQIGRTVAACTPRSTPVPGGPTEGRRAREATSAGRAPAR